MVVVRFQNSALRELHRLPPALLTRMKPIFRALEENPRPHGVKKLRGAENRHRIRVGDYRIVYEIDDEASEVITLRIRHRRDSYR